MGEKTMKHIHPNSTQSYNEEKYRNNPETFRTRIYDLLVMEDRPMTDREIIEKLDEPDVNNIRPEITRMKFKGRIFEIDRIKCPFTGKTVRRTSWKKSIEYENEQGVFF